MADMSEADLDQSGLHRPLAPVLWLTILVVGVTPFLADSTPGRTTSVVLIGGTAIMALRRSGARRSLLHASEFGVVAVALMTILTRELGRTEDWLSTLSLGLLSALLLITPLVVVVRLGARPRITLDSVAGLLAAYMQFGLFFAIAYRLINRITDDPFFAEQSTASAMDYQFFSFVTLTTLGYGNLTPASDLGQQLAVFEALIGQVFLVTIVGLAIGNLGTRIPRRRSSGEADARGTAGS
jgi:voltage-gated potassium channel Kch